MPINNPSAAYTSSAIGAIGTTLQIAQQTQPVNAVTDFGCDPTNATDCHAALQAWINAACVGHNGYLPAGTYKCSTGLTIPSGTDPVDFYTSIKGAGKLRSIINFTSDVIGLSCPNDNDNIELLDFTLSVSVTSSHPGLHADGTAGNGNSCDNWHCRISIQNFATGFDLISVSNSLFEQCEPTSVGNGFVCTGSCNSNVFINNPVGPFGIGYHLSGGRDCTIIGGDINPSGASAKAIVCDGLTAVSFNGINIESTATGTTNYPVVVSAGTVQFINCQIGNFAGSSIPTYGMNITGGGVLLINTGASGFSSTGGQIAIVDGTQVTTTTNNATITADIFASGTKIDQIQIGVLPSNSENDGKSASASTKGLLRWLRQAGSGDDVLQSFDQINGGSYVVENLLQYQSDVRSAAVAKTAVANTWSADQAIATGFKLTIGPQSGATGGLLLFRQTGVGSSVNKGFWGDKYVNGDFGFYVGASAGADPSLPYWFLDTANNRTTIGHAANTEPTGTATLNVEGTTVLGTAGTKATNIRHGISGAMTLGSVTVTDAGCTANTRYFFTTHTLGTITFPASYYAGTRTAGTSFVIKSNQATDTSTVDWYAIEP